MPTVSLSSRRSKTLSSERRILPSVPADEALSFLKDTKGALTWTIRDLADTLKISRREAEQVVKLLEAQGYVKRARWSDEWMTTPAGESVSGAKPPRFTRESVRRAVDSLKDRIKQVNRDRKSPFRVTDAVAFGDFLGDRARVQAADVGIGLERRDKVAGEFHSAPEVEAERDFLQQLRGRSALVNIRPYVEWMRKRTHLDLH
jgi:hypothetical protein